MTDTSERPETVRVEDRPLPGDLRRRIAARLEAGGIVALPTETVYGLGVRADRADALSRLSRLKGGTGARPYTWHVGSNGVLGAFEALRPLALRLAERYWPGPLTLVLHGVPAGLERVALDGWTGVRRPAHRATEGLLGELPFPVVLTSANARGGAPATTAQEIVESFGAELDLVVDGGPSRLAESSAVLRLGPGRFELLRPGLFSLEDLQRTAGLRLGFVCTGNTCRSPMAEGLARVVLARRLGLEAPDEGAFGFALVSMGILAAAGSPPAQHAVEVLRARGIDISAHRTRPAVMEKLREFDRIYGLTAGHVLALRERLPPGAGEHLELLDPRGRDVTDPIGGSDEDYRRCADQILEAVEARAVEWA